MAIDLRHGLVLAALIFTFSSAALGAVHPSHVSLTEIEFNTKSSAFEVSLCVSPEDLEKVINKLEGSSTALTDETVAKLFPKYLKTNFVVRAKSAQETEPLSIRWVGAEIGLKKCWIYFELKVENEVNKWKIENNIFFELNDDQVNHFKIKNAEKQIVWNRCSPQTPTLEFQIASKM